MRNGIPQLGNIIDSLLKCEVTRENWTPAHEDIPTVLSRAALHQGQIGWKHLVFGRIAHAMIDAVETHYRKEGLSKTKFTGKRWAQTLITHIWKVMLQLWQTRNEILHDTTLLHTSTLQRQILEERVQQSYTKAKDMTTNDRNHIFHIPEEEMLQKDSRTIKAWLTTAEQVIRHIRRKSRKKHKSSRFLENYFNWKPTRHQHSNKTKKNDLRPP